MIYLTLFFTAFLSATLLPASSEVMLSGMLLKWPELVSGLLLAATAGNVLGSCANYYLGFYITRFQDKSWFPVSPSQFHKAQSVYDKFGWWSLLLAWVPVVGDPLTVLAGTFKVRFWWFLILMIIAKGGRYVVFAYLVMLGMKA